MPKRFTATNNAIEKGLENASPKAAIGLIQGWETELEGADFSGAKGIHGDLAKLRKELEKDEPRGETVTKLVGRLGASTTKSADKVEDEKVAEQIRNLGQALTNSGSEDDGKDD